MVMGHLLQKWKIFEQNIEGLQQQGTKQSNGQNFINHWGGEKHVQHVEKRENVLPRDRLRWHSQKQEVYMEFERISE